MRLVTPRLEVVLGYHQRILPKIRAKWRRATQEPLRRSQPVLGGGQLLLQRCQRALEIHLANLHLSARWRLEVQVAVTRDTDEGFVVRYGGKRTRPASPTHDQREQAGQGHGAEAKLAIAKGGWVAASLQS